MDFKNWKVPELKQFLKKYGITTSGHKKDVLIALATCVRDLKLEEDPDRTLDDPERDVTNRLRELGITDPFLLAGYSDDFSEVPEFGLYDIFNYLICNRAEYDRKKLKAYKSYEDYRLYFDGHVSELMYSNISDSSHIGAFKAKVKPTQKDRTYLGNTSYDLWFLMEKDSGEVKAAYCQCPGGADGACRHVAAALYALESFEKPSVTDGPCLWKKRPMEHDQPVPIKKLRIQSVRYGVAPDKKDTDFDPRHPMDRAPLSHSEEMEFAKRLKEIQPSASALGLLLEPTELEKEKMQVPENEECLKLSIKSKAAEFLKSHLPDHIKSTSEQSCALFMSTLCYTQEQLNFIESETTGQHDNQTWHEMRNGVITTSTFRRILSRTNSFLNNPTTDMTAAVDCVMGIGPPPPEGLRPLEWGRTKERVARSMYARVETKKHCHLKVTVPGFMLCSNKPYLGCSTDGIVSCTCKEKHAPKLLEIKCPHSLRLRSPKDAAKDKDCVFTAGVWHLSEHSEYYAQIQGQLGIYGLQECDLIIFTTQGIHVVTVPFNRAYFSQMVNKLEYFYRHFVAPRLLASISDG